MTESHSLNPEAMLANASQHREAQRADDAEILYRQILEALPQHREAQIGLIEMLYQSGRDAEAIPACRQLLAQHPDDSQVLGLMGELMVREGRYDEGFALCQRAQQLGLETSDNYRNIGDILSERGQPEEALANFHKALAISPDNAATHTVIGHANCALKRYDEARASYERSLELKPGNAFAQWNLGYLFMLLGDYERGLALHEDRFNFAVEFWPARRNFSVDLLWDGSDLQGKTILVWAEQGMGDNIMMMRYLPLLKQKGASSVILYSHKVLVKILRTMSNMVIDAADGAHTGMFDCHCSMISLPYLFKSTLNTIPTEVPYLHLPTGAGKQWAKALGNFPGLKVGLTWAGGTNTARDSLRSTSLQQLAPLMTVPGVQFVVIQKGDYALDQLQAVDWPVLNWMDASNDLADTAALIDQLDLVISVDTVIVHLAGALGKPVWLLNRYESEWRWLPEGETSPWYPTLRIFRQPAIHDWASVVARMTEELKALVAGRNVKPLTLAQWRSADNEAKRMLGIGKDDAAGNDVGTTLLSRVKNWFR